MAALIVIVVGVGGWTAALAEVAPPSLLPLISTTPSPTPSPRLTPTPRTPTLRPTLTPEPTPEANRETDQTPTPEPTFTPDELTPTPTAMPEPSPTPTPTPVPTRTPTGIQYSVQAGDSLSSIAAQVGVDLDTIMLTNGLTVDSVLIPGQTLQVPRSPGAFHMVGPDESLSAIAALYAVNLRDIADANGIEDPSLIYVGQRLFIPGAKALPPTPRPTATPEATPTPSPSAPPSATSTPLATSASSATALPSVTPTRLTGIATQPAVPSTGLASPTPGASLVTSGNATSTPIPPKGFAGPSARLIWPLRADISQPFGENGHTGIDLMGDLGVPLVAAADGVITLTAISDIGYGNRIEIDHAGGISTLYGHLSVIQVTQGQQIRQGQVIGLVGDSGWATGPHLHFEVRQAGVPVNPLNYLP